MAEVAIHVGSYFFVEGLHELIVLGFSPSVHDEIKEDEQDSAGLVAVEKECFVVEVKLPPGGQSLS